MGIEITSNRELRYRLLDESTLYDPKTANLHYGQNQENILYPCQPIIDGAFKLGIVDNNNLNPNRLRVRDADKKPIKVTIPQSIEYPTRFIFDF